MKPNPCKWCGQKVSYMEGDGYWCNCRGRFDAGVDFDTWQKNNPLSDLDAEMKMADFSLKEEPHQLKVGDWVKWEGKKYQVEEVRQYGNGWLLTWGGISVNANSCSPTTRLKRKEIRERLYGLTQTCSDLATCMSITALIEEI